MGRKFAQLPFYQRFLIEIAAIYLFVVVGVYFYQRSMEYFPYNAPLGAPKDAGVPEMSEVHAKTADGLDLVAWFAPPKNRSGRVVVLFHGNGGNIVMRADKARMLIDRGYGVFLAEYRGFGGNPGSPSEQGLYEDGRAAIQWVENKGYKKDQIVIYGESIGTGVAVQMALEIQPKILILEAPFSSAAEVAKDAYHHLLPVDLLMKDRFDSIDKIGGIKTDLLVIHGTADVIVPMKFGVRLFDAANRPKRLFVVHGGNHTNLYNFGAGEKIAAWLDQQIKGGKGT
jgi:fermentation-respiration switch protein FrsA (DUF1100 family)